MASRSVAIDVVLDNAKQDEVASHHDKRDNPRHGCYHGCHQCTEDTSSESEEECDECKTASDRVEDHDAGKSLRCIFGCGIEVGCFDLCHDCTRVIANDLWEAVILVGPVHNCQLLASSRYKDIRSRTQRERHREHSGQKYRMLQRSCEYQSCW